MRTTRMMFALSCASLFALCVPAFGQPLPTPKPNAASQPSVKKKAVANDSAARLRTIAIARPPKAPPMGWPALVKEARKYMGTNPTDRDRLWCATFMNMVLANTGYTGTNSDAARSFAQYGRRVSEPKVGAIAVLTRGKNGGHVGVVSGVDANGNPIVISGNHGRKVGEAIYPRARVIAYVMPSERSSGQTQVAARNEPNRSSPDDGLESPIAELLAAIAAESRAESPRQPVRQAAQQPRAAAPQASQASRRDLPLDPALAEFLGLNERQQQQPQAVRQQPQPQPQAYAPAPQRELRVEQRASGRIASNDLPGLPVSR